MMDIDGFPDWQHEEERQPESTEMEPQGTYTLPHAKNAEYATNDCIAEVNESEGENLEDIEGALDDDDDDDDYDNDDELEEQEEGYIRAKPYQPYLGAQQGDGWYYPYDSKAMAYLDMLDNLPRQKISSRILKFVIAILRGCGVEEVPSLQRFREKQKELAKSGIKRHLFNIGSETLYVNDPCDIIANDWANPTVRSRMQLYPEDKAQNQKSEVWHGTRWSEFPEFLQPMVLHPDDTEKQFFVDEVCRKSSGELVVPTQWLCDWSGKLLAKARTVDGVSAIPR